MNKGFTLIEMIVAVGVFTVAITISLASFLNISAIQKRAEAFRAVNNNLNFALESMVREIRTGWDYDSSSDNSSLTITNSNISEGEYEVIFSLDANQIKRKFRDEDPLALTAPEVKITNLQFILASSGQPMVTILINGVIEEKGEIKSHLNLQTTVSQRKIK